MEHATKFNSGTYISVGLVIACMGTVYMFGMQKQRIDDLTERIQRQEAYAGDVATMKEQVRQLTITLNEVRTDVKDIKQIKEKQDK